MYDPVEQVIEMAGQGFNVLEAYLETNPCEQRTITQSLTRACLQYKWIVIQNLCALTGKNALSPKEITDALKASYRDISTVQYLCKLPTSKLSQEGVLEFFDQVLGYSMAANRYSDYCWEILAYLSQLRTENKPNREAMEKLLKVAIGHKQWALVRDLVSWEEENAPSKEANGEALLLSYNDWQTIHHLCCLPKLKQPSQDHVSLFSKKVLEEALSSGASTYPWNILVFLCQLTDENQPDRDTIDLILKSAASNHQETLVKVLVLLRGSNAPTQGAVNEALLASYHNFGLIQYLCQLNTSNRPDQKTAAELCFLLAGIDHLEAIQFLFDHYLFDQVVVDKAFERAIFNMALDVMDYFISKCLVNKISFGQEMFTSGHVEMEQLATRLLIKASTSEVSNVLSFMFELMQEKIIPANCLMAALNSVANRDAYGCLLTYNQRWSILSYHELSDLQNLMMTMTEETSSEDRSVGDYEPEAIMLTAFDEGNFGSYYPSVKLFLSNYNMSLRPGLFIKKHSPLSREMVQGIKMVLEQPESAENIAKIEKCITVFLYKLLKDDIVSKTTTVALLDRYQLLNFEHKAMFDFLPGCSEYICRSIQKMDFRQKLDCFIFHYRQINKCRSSSSAAFIKIISYENCSKEELKAAITCYLDGILRNSTGPVKSTTTKLLSVHSLLEAKHYEMFSFDDVDSLMIVKKEKYFEENEPVSKQMCLMQ